MGETPLGEGWSVEDGEALIGRDVAKELLHVPVWVSVDPPDNSWAESVCVRPATHHVRGHAESAADDIEQFLDWRAV